MQIVGKGISPKPVFMGAPLKGIGSGDFCLHDAFSFQNDAMINLKTDIFCRFYKLNFFQSIKIFILV